MDEVSTTMPPGAASSECSRRSLGPMPPESGEDLLPEPGPPFRVGERVAFAATVIGPTRLWLDWEEVVIVDLDDEAKTFGFRHVSEVDDARHAQDLENIVRVTPNYRAWRTAWEASYARKGAATAAVYETCRPRL